MCAVLKQGLGTLPHLAPAHRSTVISCHVSPILGAQPRGPAWDSLNTMHSLWCLCLCEHCCLCLKHLPQPSFIPSWTFLMLRSMVWSAQSHLPFLLTMLLSVESFSWPSSLWFRYPFTMLPGELLRISCSKFTLYLHSFFFSWSLS